MVDSPPSIVKTETMKLEAKRRVGDNNVQGMRILLNRFYDGLVGFGYGLSTMDYGLH